MSVLIWQFLHLLITKCKQFLCARGSTSQELCFIVFFHQLFSKPGPRRHFRLVASPPRPSNTLCCLFHRGPQGVLEAVCDFKEKIRKRQKHVLQTSCFWGFFFFFFHSHFWLISGLTPTAAVARACSFLNSWPPLAQPMANALRNEALEGLLWWSSG